MFEDASKILEIVVEFCQENMNMLMIAGVALIVLVLIISLVRPSKEDEDFEFDEFAKEPTPSLISVQQPLRTAEVEVEAPKLLEDEPEQKIEDPKIEEKIEEHKVTPVFTKNTVSLGAIVEELAEITGEGVKKVEIKIPGAEVRITYLDEEKEEAVLEEALPEKEVGRKEETEKLQSEVEDNKETEDALNSETAPEIKKFGPDNMNVARSGKVYSEEELQKQIRD